MNTMELQAWSDATTAIYLEDFIPAGGASVKFAVGVGEVTPSEIASEITGRATDLGYLTASIDAAKVKIGSVEQLVGAIVDQIDLGALIDQLVITLLALESYLPPEEGPDGLGARIAAANDYEASAIVQDLRPLLRQHVFQNAAIAQDMRAAVTTLCVRRLTGGEQMASAFTTVADWLGGRTRKLSVLREMNIHSKVNRSNARYLFESFLQVIRLAGLPGLVITVDISRFLATERDAERVNYAKASLLDAYEVLREFVDATDDLENFLMVVTAPTPFLDTNEHGRGLGRYPALLNRVYDEVRDRVLPNPLAALVRVGSNVPEELR